MPPSTAAEPPDSPLPAPRGTTGTRCAAAQRTAVCTCSASSARTTASGVPADDVAGPVEAVLLHGVGVGDDHPVGQGVGQLGERVHGAMEPLLTTGDGSLLVGVRDVGQLPPDQHHEDRRAGEREPERRGDAPLLGEQRRRSPEPTTRPPYDADHVDAADPALQLRRARPAAGR